MKGLTDKCLVYMMTLDEYLTKQDEFKSMYKLSITNLFKYLNSVGIRPHLPISEETAYVMELDENLFTYVQDMIIPDFVFMCKENIVFNHIKNLDTIKYPKIYNKIIKKYPTLRNVDEDTRFDQVISRTKKVLKDIESEYILFIHTGSKTKKDMEKEGTFHLYISTKSFLLEASVSGSEVSTHDLLQVPYSHKYMNEWEV